MEQVKKRNYFKYFIYISFFIFISLYISKEAGYYEYINYKNMTITNDNIKEFESEIKAGKNINDTDYIIKEKIDYSNKMTNLGYYLGSNIQKFLNKGIKSTVSILNKLFVE